MERPPPVTHRIYKTTNLLTKKITTMKTMILKISAFFLLFALLGAGCKKEKNDYDPTSIVGKWAQINDGACIGYNNSMIEITADSIFKDYINNVLTYSSKITIKKSKYDWDTIFFEKGANNRYKYMYLTKIGNDTLTLDPPINTIAPLCTTYKRLN
jgi:hypothetical protein